MTKAASRFINISGPHNNAFGVRIQSLCPVGRSAAFDADSQRFCNIFGNRQELGNRFERLPHVILIQTRNNNPFAVVGQLLAHINDIGFEKLGLIDTNNVRVFRQIRNFRRGLNSNGWNFLFVL